MERPSNAAKSWKSWWLGKLLLNYVKYNVWYPLSNPIICVQFHNYGQRLIECCLFNCQISCEWDMLNYICFKEPIKNKYGEINIGLTPKIWYKLGL